MDVLFLGTRAKLAVGELLTGIETCTCTCFAPVVPVGMTNVREIEALSEEFYPVFWSEPLKNNNSTSYFSLTC